MVKKFLKYTLITLCGIIGIIFLYLLSGYLLPFVSVPAEKTSDPKIVDIYILTNGVHTDLVLPIKNNLYDWTQEIPFENTRSKRTDYRYVSFGWGDKGFYMDTPTWAELKPSTALKAAFWLGESAMHVTYYYKMVPGKDCVKIPVTEKQYKRLVQYIHDKFDRDASGKIIHIETDALYGNNDAFYDAKGKYSFLDTCNTWANSGLKAAGQKAALWTPSDFGIFQQYE